MMQKKSAHTQQERQTDIKTELMQSNESDNSNKNNNRTKRKREKTFLCQVFLFAPVPFAHCIRLETVEHQLVATN